MNNIEQRKNDILNIIKNNNIYLLRKYINDNNVNMKELNEHNFDILIYAIEKNASIEIIKFIMNQCQYESYNYIINENNKDKVPLYSAIARNKFKIADLLIKNNADINFFNPNIIVYLYNIYFLNPMNLKYILNNGFNKKCIDYDLIFELIERKKDELLEIIFKHYIFNNNFILYLLRVYNNKEPFSDKQLEKLITIERSKISVNESMYEKAIEKGNYNSIRVLFNNDSSEHDVIFCRINEYDLLEKAVKINDYNFVKNVLRYEPFNFKSINSKEILLEVNRNNNMEIMKMLVNSALEDHSKKQNPFTGHKYDKHFLNLILNMMIKIKNLKFIKYFVESDEYKFDIDLNSKDTNDEYPIITAFYSDDLEIFDYIMEHGGDCNAKNCNGNTIVSLAIDKSDGNEYIKRMLKHNVHPIKEEFINGSDSLMKAINNNNINIVILLVRYGIQHHIDMNVIDRNGNTPLTLSYRLNYHNIFKFLIKYLDINQIDFNGNSVLYYVILKEDVETMRSLISNGADVNFKNKFGKSNMDLIISEGYTFLNTVLNYSYSIQLNIPNSQGEIPLITVIKSNIYTDEEKEDMIEKLIRRGSNVNFIDNTGNTALVYAIQKKSLSLVNILIKNDANINYLIPSKNLTILMYAIELKELNIIQRLIEYGIDINYKNTDGYTAFEKASEKDKIEIFEYLVKYDINNFTSEMINSMISKERLDLIKILLDHNFDINLKDDNDDTPLVYAIRNRKVDIAVYLIMNGANINNKNKQGETIEFLNTKYFYDYGWQKAYDTIRKLINMHK